jgi:hypothetical protein
VHRREGVGLGFHAQIRQQVLHQRLLNKWLTESTASVL